MMKQVIESLETLGEPPKVDICCYVIVFAATIVIPPFNLAICKLKVKRVSGSSFVLIIVIIIVSNGLAE